MNRGITIATVCFLCAGLTHATADLYAFVQNPSGTYELLRLEGGKPANAQVVGETGLRLTGSAYDPRIDKFIARSPEESRFYQVDRQTGQATPFPGTAITAGGMTYVPSVDELYIVTEGPGGIDDDEISRVLPDGTVEPVFDLQGQVNDLDALIWNPVSSELIGIDSQSGKAYVIDEFNGSVIETRMTDITLTTSVIGDINPDNGLYYTLSTAFPPSSPLITIDLTTGNTIDTLGIIPNAPIVGSVSFVPEPATSACVLAALAFVIRRRGQVLHTRW